MKKKIGVLTYHHVMNEGAILQAYSQFHALQDHLADVDVEIIDYRMKCKDTEEFKNLFLKRLRKFDFQAVKRYMKLKRFINQELPLSRRRLKSDDYGKAIRFIGDEYSAIVVGSDEVWKSICDGDRIIRPFPNIYWLSPNLDCKKVAMAASANRCDYNKISKRNKKVGRKLLQEFDFIGVRDQHTVEFVRSLGVKKEVQKVPDPAFSFDLTKDYDEAIKEKLKRRGVDLNRPVLCFRTGGTEERNKLCKAAERYFRDKGYQTVSIGGPNRYADHNLSDMFDPFEWAHVYKFFDFCITDRFHGTVFCLKNGIPFLSIEDDDYYKRIKSKIVDLLEDFEMMNHYLYLDGSDYDIEQILSDIEDSFSAKEVRKKVDLMRGQYHEMLETIGEII